MPVALQSARRTLWRQIAEDLDAAIRNGDLPPGVQLPTEHELAERYNVNRHTVRRALAMLQDDGRVEVTQGRGSFVRRPVTSFPATPEARIGQFIRVQRETPAGGDLSAKLEPGARGPCEALGVRPGVSVLVIEKRGFAGETPVALSTHVLLGERLTPEFFEAYRDGASIVDALEASGITGVHRKTLKVRARAASVREHAALELPRFAPLLVTESVEVDGEGRPIEHTTIRFASDRVEVVFDIPKGSAGW